MGGGIREPNKSYGVPMPLYTSTLLLLHGRLPARERRVFPEYADATGHVRRLESELPCAEATENRFMEKRTTNRVYLDSTHCLGQ